MLNKKRKELTTEEMRLMLKKAVTGVMPQNRVTPQPRNRVTPQPQFKPRRSPFDMRGRYFA